MAKLSPSNRVTASERHGWEHDTTLQLIGLDSVDIALQFCRQCWHSTLSPSFDSSRLYTPEAAELRRKAIAESGKPMGRPPIWQAMSGEAMRFAMHAKALTKIACESPKVSEIRIVDIGGGDGFVGNVYAAFMGHLAGVRGEAVVIEPIPRPNIQADRIVDTQSAASASYDVAALSHVLEHVFDPLTLLEQAYGLLKPGGVLVVEVPDNRMQWISAVLRRKFLLHYHVQHFSRTSLHRLVRRAGFQSLSSAYLANSSYHGHPVPAIFVAAVKPRVDGGNKDDADTLPSAAQVNWREILSLAKHVFLRGMNRFSGKR